MQSGANGRAGGGERRELATMPTLLLFSPLLRRLAYCDPRTWTAPSVWWLDMVGQWCRSTSYAISNALSFSGTALHFNASLLPSPSIYRLFLFCAPSMHASFFFFFCCPALKRVWWFPRHIWQAATHSANNETRRRRENSNNRQIINLGQQ